MLRMRAIASRPKTRWLRSNPFTVLKDDQDATDPGTKTSDSGEYSDEFDAMIPHYG